MKSSENKEENRGPTDNLNKSLNVLPKEYHHGVGKRNRREAMRRKGGKTAEPT